MLKLRTEGHQGFPWMTVLSLALAALLLFLALRGVQWSELLATLRQGRFEYLLLGFALFTGSYFLRGLRWRILLRAERPVLRLTTFWGTVVGYLGNGFLPARAGELIRTVMVGRATGISKSFVLATAFTERLIDVLALVLLSTLALLWLSGLPEWFVLAVRAMAGLGLIGLLMLIMLPRLEPWLQHLLTRMPLPAGLQASLHTMLEKFLLGMRALQQPFRAAHFAGLTVAIWLTDALMAMIVAQSLNLNLNLAQALLLLAALGLSSAIPSTPGYIGIYQFVAVTILPPFGFTQSSALAYIITFQALTYVVIVVWGFLGLWRLNLPQNQAPQTGSIP